ncbi:hypothetical protein [Synechococcus sp. CBW1107]|uniref:hypothetical protein n=1 Tax=Synechococcus sp. CBW1107 TaxID=2789857 RepID=UPI002AD56771|nr:hypothetical protein [Synechococcus sp. CBW1107]
MLQQHDCLVVSDRQRFTQARACFLIQSCTAKRLQTLLQHLCSHACEAIRNTNQPNKIETKRRQGLP